MFFSKSLCSLLASAIAVAAVQHPLGSFGERQRSDAKTSVGSTISSNFELYDASLFTPVEELSVLSAEEFTTLAHPAFPKYNVRIKKSNWCDGSVR